MTRKLKVLLTAHIRWYNAEADYVFRLARGLIERGHQAVIWGWPDSPLVERARAASLPVFTAGDPGSLNPAAVAAASRTLARLLREGGFDAVNAHRSEGYPVIAWTAQRSGALVVRTRGDMRPANIWFSRMIYGHWTDRLIVANELIREDLVLRLGLPPEKVTTINLGINPGEFRPSVSPEAARQELGIRSGARVVAAMARLGPVKGLEFFLRAAEKVAAELPEAVFMVLYPDVECSDPFLPALARSRIKDRFVLVGPRGNPADAAQLAEVAVIPSVGSEAHCRVALQWMSLSVPLIASRVGVIPEIVDHGQTGYLVQPRYADTIAHCLVKLLKDPELARTMGEAGKQRLLDRFCEDEMVERNLEVFNTGIRV